MKCACGGGGGSGGEISGNGDNHADSGGNQFVSVRS